MILHDAIRIGISGWRYKPWRGVFYPPRLPQRRELEFAATHFNSVEINGTFYSMQRPESFRRWHAETPEGFLFAIKGARFITHMKKLRGVEQGLANFFAQGVLALGKKLGPVLWQLPPQLAFDADRLAGFFDLLPRTHADAAVLAHDHAPRFQGRSVVEAEAKGTIRHCVEVRHGSFVTPEFARLLRKHRIGLVVADTVEWPLLFDVTADFIYCRLHGSEQLYVSGYESDAIDRWGERIVAWSRGQEVADEAEGCTPRGIHCAPKHIARPARARDVYCYFDNDAKVRAPFDAIALRDRVRELQGATPRGDDRPAR
ncbi:DUF72 domain-containing protein [Terriglobus aquaticus]|uniref:DUF72 domain-containing protein n=1 Tax=Terriglobus aquaticus TaxID=940139 RepID=A0ABW9KG12_9BACT|nr:DUF72 domain-containing protein [Terriglobus aquaticus]